MLNLEQCTVATSPRNASLIQSLQRVPRYTSAVRVNFTPPRMAACRTYSRRVRPRLAVRTRDVYGKTATTIRALVSLARLSLARRVWSNSDTAFVLHSQHWRGCSMAAKITLVKTVNSRVYLASCTDAVRGTSYL